VCFFVKGPDVENIL